MVEKLNAEAPTSLLNFFCPGMNFAQVIQSNFKVAVMDQCFEALKSLPSKKNVHLRDDKNGNVVAVKYVKTVKGLSQT